MDASVANVTLQLKEEVIRLRKQISDERKKYQGQIDNLAESFVLESEKCGKLQRQNELLENEVGTLKAKLGKKVDQSNANEFTGNIDYNEMEFLFAKGKIVKLENDVNNKEEVIINLKEKLKVVLDDKKKLKHIIQEQKITAASLVDDISELDEKAEEWKNLYNQAKEKLDELKLERDNEERKEAFISLIPRIKQSKKTSVPVQSFNKSDINNEESKTEERPFRRNTSQLTLPPITGTETISSLSEKSGMNYGKYQPTPPDQPRKYQPTPPDLPRPDHPKREMRKEQNVDGDRNESNANDRVWFVSF